MDILDPLRAQHPGPLLVSRNQDILGTVGLEVILPAHSRLAQTRVADVMRPAPRLDVGERVEQGSAAVRRDGGDEVVVTKPTGGLFSRQSEPVGIVSIAQVLAAIGKNVVDKAPMKLLSGHRDLGFNLPITPCQRNCPIRQDIATYIDYVSQGRYVDSWSVIHETNPFPSILGRLCNHPCETDCKRGWDPGEEPVTIRSIKRFSTDFAFQQGLWIDYKIAPPKGKRVAVVGAGPAGLTAALDLRVQGYDVVLYERESKVGGLLSTSIPPFRFDHRQLQWELQMILATGIDVRTSANVGTGPGDMQVQDLLAEYDAVFVTVGMMKGRILPIPGSDLPEVTDAMTFLREVSYDKIPDHFPVGGRVVVVGGGAVATDACQTSIKLGAREVWMVAIEPEDHLPAFGNELHEAKEIGLRIQCGVIVKEIHGGSTGGVSAVSFAPLHELQFDELSGKLIFASVKEIERTDDHRQSEAFARTEPGILEAAKRYDMTEVEQPWSDREAIVQSIRCFQCDSVHHYDQSVCVLCGACDDVCPEKAIDVVVFGEDRERSSGGDTLVCKTSGGNPEGGGYEGEIFINYDRCTNCRICEDHCPVNCITFERVRFIDDVMRVTERPDLKPIPLLATG